MRTIKLGEKEITIKATPLTLLYYKQAFGSDLVGDFTKFQNVMNDPSKLDSLAILQMVWSMSKAAEGVGTKFPDFQTWLSELDSIDFSDQETMIAVMEEIKDGFFCRAGQAKQRKR